MAGWTELMMVRGGDAGSFPKQKQIDPTQAPSKLVAFPLNAANCSYAAHRVRKAFELHNIGGIFAAHHTMYRPSSSPQSAHAYH